MTQRNHYWCWVSLCFEVATAAAFLLSEAANYVSGQDLIVDGGLVGSQLCQYGVTTRSPYR